MTALTRAGVVDSVVDRATVAWRRWEGHYGRLDAPLIARPKPLHKVLGLTGVVVSAALTALCPAWSLDVHHDAKNNPVSVEIRGADPSPVFIPVAVHHRKLRLASPGWGEREGPVVGLSSAKAGSDFLLALAQAAAVVLVPMDMEGRGRRVF